MYLNATHVSILILFSIFPQVNITNPTRRLVKFDVFNKLLYSPTAGLQVNITKPSTNIFKMAASRFVEVTDKEISEIKINSVSKTQKTCVKILKQLFASGSVIIGKYSPRLHLGEYSPIITSPSANNC